ncbi:MAG: hypothetical protein JSS07_06435 [Proteobacteria bacterium]|nr:hypothetical protein [Pseudomonadota bacterium]
MNKVSDARNKMVVLVLCCMGMLLIPIALKFFTIPYFWIGCSWTLIFSILFLKSYKNTLAAVYINFAVITLFLCVCEIYFWWSNTPVPEKLVGNYWTPQMFKPDPFLGYVPQKNAKEVVGKRYLDNQLIYEMIISTDQHGLRNSYPKSTAAKGAILFFGCSFTFGVGVNDNETLPYQVGSKLQGQANVYNFGYGGYGPQQMLSALEQGLVDKIVLEQPKHAFYVAIPSHIVRSAGLTSWNIHDPKYDLDEKGEIYYAGHFDEKTISLPHWVQQCYSQLNKSYLWQKIQASLLRKINDRDIDRYIKIVIKAKTIFEQRYPQAKFNIIYWNIADIPNHEVVMKKLLTEFKKSEIPVYLVDNMITDFKINQAYYLIEKDGHPNPRANACIASYVVNQILQPE